MVPRRQVVVTTLFVLAALVAGCSSADSDAGAAEPTASATSTDVAEPTVAAEPTATPEPQATAEPEVPAGMARITFELTPTLDDLPMSEPESFLVSEIQANPAVEVGFLDETGAILLPRELLGSNFLVEAETPNDPLCWWSTVVFINNTTPDRSVIDADLDLICA